MTMQPSLFDQLTKPAPGPARTTTKTVCVIDLEKIRQELHELANPMNGEPIPYHNRVKVLVKKDREIEVALQICEDDNGYTIKFNPTKLVTQEKLDNALATCRKAVSGW